MSAYDEIRFFNTEDGWREPALESQGAQNEYLVNYRYLLLDIGDDPYTTIAEAAVQERKTGRTRRQIAEFVTVGYVPKGTQDFLRKNWLSTRVRMDNKIFPPGTPDRCEETQEVFRESINAIYWTFVEKNRNKTLSILRKMNGRSQAAAIGAKAPERRQASDPWLHRRVYHEEDPSHGRVVAFIRIEAGCEPEWEFARDMVGIYTPTSKGLLRVSPMSKHWIDATGCAVDLSLTSPDDQHAMVIGFVLKASMKLKAFGGPKFSVRMNPFQTL
jgi:hypothetical protein